MLDRLLLLCDMLRAFVWGPPMLVLLAGTGVYFTLQTRLFQIRCAPFWLRRTLFSCFSGRARRKADKNAVSPFAVMCTALAATVGTGNIAGVAAALTAGGPGAVFWMWVSAFFGMMTGFAENTLGMLYRERGADGAWRGGPMLYLKNGLHSPLLAGAFALFCMLASFGMGNMSQCNAIAEGIGSVFGVPPLVTGLCTAGLLGCAMLGGLRRISRVTEALVPFMAVFYLGGALTVLFVHREALLPALRLIVSEAFCLRAGAGGVLGYGVMQAVRTGVARGVFSNEAGLGSSVMVHAAADASEPCGQGMWAVFEVFFDTIVMCTITALVILCSGVYQGAGGLTGARLTAAAFSTVFGRPGGSFVALSLVLFAFSTLPGWSYYGQRAAEYLLGAWSAPVYRVLFIAAAAAGCMMRLDLVWAVSDVFNGLMALPNLAGVLALRREILAEWQHFCRANHL
ncbi:MAG: alanine/glycine:cation symporter family protein [Agathobaculum sp.]|uniref:alanine/glycine:cation symporter family protein n=1 Tax=Agathobaculum sp. TaxID=2048138 RepID=UPI003D915648